MNERIALIWFSCFCCASENFRSTPAEAADSWIDLVLAVRQPLSAPTWAKPIVRVSVAAPADGGGALPPPDGEPQAVRPAVSRARAAAVTRRAVRDVVVDNGSPPSMGTGAAWAVSAPPSSRPVEGVSGRVGEPSGTTPNGRAGRPHGVPGV